MLTTDVCNVERHKAKPKFKQEPDDSYAGKLVNIKMWVSQLLNKIHVWSNFYLSNILAISSYMADFDLKLTRK